jgi:proteic killer suppression protein
MLTAMSEAANIAEIGRYSGWRLHPLKGDRRGTWAMVVTRNYRLTFRLSGSNVSEIDLEDYHGK